jgi:hypothetical protein
MLACGDLVEIFDDDRGIDDDLAVVVERRHDAVRIERQIVRLELVAGQEVELLLGERLALGVEHEAHPLRAGRLRGVVELEGHGVFLIGDGAVLVSVGPNDIEFL